MENAEWVTLLRQLGDALEVCEDCDGCKYWRNRPMCRTECYHAADAMFVLAELVEKGLPDTVEETARLILTTPRIPDPQPEFVSFE